MYAELIPGVTKHFARGLEYGSTHNDHIKLFLDYAEFISRYMQKNTGSYLFPVCLYN